MIVQVQAICRTLNAPVSFGFQYLGEINRSTYLRFVAAILSECGLPSQSNVQWVYPVHFSDMRVFQSVLENSKEKRLDIVFETTPANVRRIALYGSGSDTLQKWASTSVQLVNDVTLNEVTMYDAALYARTESEPVPEWFSSIPLLQCVVNINHFNSKEQFDIFCCDVLRPPPTAKNSSGIHETKLLLVGRNPDCHKLFRKLAQHYDFNMVSEYSITPSKGSMNHYHHIVYLCFHPDGMTPFFSSPTPCSSVNMWVPGFRMWIDQLADSLSKPKHKIAVLAPKAIRTKFEANLARSRQSNYYIYIDNMRKFDDKFDAVIFVTGDGGVVPKGCPTGGKGVVKTVHVYDLLRI